MWRWLPPLACALVTLAVLWPCLGNQFVDWDDNIALVDNPEFRGLAWRNLGWMFNQGRLEAAERETLTALQLRPEWELAQTNLAAILARQGRFERAGEARAQLGYLYLEHENFKAAVDLFQKEVSARPGDAAAHNNLGTALLLHGDVGPAIEHFERALEIDPGHDRARRNLASARQVR